MGRVKYGFNGSMLKLVALITMLVDHTACVMVDAAHYPEAYEIMRGVVGRISFPLFCFLLTEGFVHTHNAVKYAFRLGLFAILSEIPFDLAFYHRLWQPEHQNVFFTLLLGFLALYFLEKVLNLCFWKKPFMTGLKILSAAGTVFLFCILAFFLHSDYSYSGVLLIAAFYLFRGRPVETFLSNTFFNFWKMQPFGILSAPFIALYNGKRGWNLKYFFYLFYPLHLFLLYLISS